jgi:hypothetical protein
LEGAQNRRKLFSQYVFKKKNEENSEDEIEDLRIRNQKKIDSVPSSLSSFS